MEEEQTYYIYSIIRNGVEYINDIEEREEIGTIWELQQYLSDDVSYFTGSTIQVNGRIMAISYSEDFILCFQPKRSYDNEKEMQNLTMDYDKFI